MLFVQTWPAAAILIDVGYKASRPSRVRRKLQEADR